MRRRLFIPHALACGIAVLTLTACNQSQFGGELTAKPQPLAIQQATGQTLRIPQQEPFSIALPRSRQEPGLGGQADAQADAQPGGSATATATVQGGGTAQAGFQLGHAFRNETDRQFKLDIAFSYDYEMEASAEPETPYADCQVELMLFVRKERGAAQPLTLLQHSTENGAASRAAQRETARISVILPPQETVNIYLAGQAAINIEADRSAQGRLALRDVQLAVDITPAPPVGTFGDER